MQDRIYKKEYVLKGSKSRKLDKNFQDLLHSDALLYIKKCDDYIILPGWYEKYNSGAGSNFYDVLRHLLFIICQIEYSLCFWNKQIKGFVS